MSENEKKFSVLVLCYGDFPEVSLRAVNSVIENRDNPEEPRKFDIHVGANACGETTKNKLRELLDLGKIDSLLETNENIHKCPMKRLLIDRSSTEYLMWMDDDSHVHPGWETEITDFINHKAPFDVAGKTHVMPRELNYLKFMRERPWYISDQKFVENGASLVEGFFATGGLYLMRSEFVREHNYPDKAVVKRRDDLLLGDLVAQVGGTLLPFTDKVAKVISIDDSDRRGGGEDIESAFTKLDPTTGKDNQVPLSPEEQEFKDFLDSQDVNKMNDYANRIKREGKLDWAEEIFLRALKIAPDLPELNFNIANTLKDLGRTEEAIHYFEEAIRLRQNYADAYNNLGICLGNLGKNDEAVDAYSIAIEQDPNNSPALNNLGNLLLEQGEYEKAADCFEKALKISPEFKQIHHNLGNAYTNLHRDNDALVQLRLAQHHHPNANEPLFNQSFTWLANGNYDLGLSLYERRFQCTPSLLKLYNAPLWRGENISNETILVYQEQSNAETIWLSRYIPLLRKKCKKVIVECLDSIKDLIATTGDIEVISAGDEPPSFDKYISLTSLPFLFKTRLENIPHSIPYIHLPKSQPKVTLTKRPELKVTILASAEKDHQSIPSSNLEPLSELEGISFFGLESNEEDCTSSFIKYLCVDKHSPLDRSAYIEASDVVIAVNSPDAHLAAAMGKPTIVLLDKYASWVWMRDKETHPWYPNVRLIRQEESGSWQQVVNKLKEILNDEIDLFYGKFEGSPIVTAEAD